MSGIEPVVPWSAWQLLRTSELPEGAWCRSVANDRQQNVWHAWNTSGFCDFHKVNGMKAPVALAVANRRRAESARRPRREESA